jgi:hypothetical protein
MLPFSSEVFLSVFRQNYRLKYVKLLFCCVLYVCDLGSVKNTD